MIRELMLGLALWMAGINHADVEQAPNSRAAFNRLKGLAGTWSSTAGGRSSTMAYKLTGNGSVLMEEMGGMATAYYLDGDKLTLTHFCGAGNQPRMRIREMSDRHMSFEMFDITNLADPRAYHTTHLDIRFLEGERVSLAYRGVTNGEVSTQTFILQRK